MLNEQAACLILLVARQTALCEHLDMLAAARLALELLLLGQLHASSTG